MTTTIDNNNTNHHQEYEGDGIHLLSETSDEIPTNNTYLYILTAISAIGGFLFGYDTGVISGALVLLQDPQHGLNLNIFQSEVVVSSTIIGAIFGSFSGGTLNSRFGRRKVIIASSITFTIGAAIMALAPSYSWLVCGRFAVGVAVGLASMTVPMYLAEVAPAQYRGTLVSLNTLFITGGQFSASIVDGVFSNSNGGWRYMLGIAMIPSILQWIAFIFLPESPRWLVSNGRVNEATDALQKIRMHQNVQGEISEIINDVKSSSSNTSSNDAFREIMSSTSLQRALILGCTLQALQQFSGINTVMYYSATIIQMAGFTDNSEAIWLSSVVAFSNFLFTIVGIYFVDKVGRRSLTIKSLTGVTLALFMLGLSFYIAETNSVSVIGVDECSELRTCFDCVADHRCGYCSETRTGHTGLCLPGNSTISNGACNSDAWSFATCPNSKPVIGWLIVFALFLYLACFAPGMGPMPWTVNAEIYPLHVRSTCISISTGINWVANLFVAFTFLSISRTFSPYGAFWLYTVIAAAGVGFLSLYLPETKGLALEDIERLFENPRKS